MFRWIDSTEQPYFELDLTVELHLGSRVLWSELVQVRNAEYSIDIPWEMGTRGRPVVKAYAQVPLHMAAVSQTRVHFKEGRPQPVELDVDLGDSAPVLRGRVVSDDGEPVEDVIVELWKIDEERPVLAESGGFNTDRDGRYTLQAYASGLYRTSTTSDMGLGALGAFRVDGRDLHLPDLVLKTGGRLKGKAVLPTGEPLPYLSLRVEPAHSIRTGGGEAITIQRSGFRPADAVLELDGMPGALLRTDERGRFALAGLTPTPFFIQGGNDVRVVDGEGPHLPNKDDIVLVVELYEVEVVVETSDRRFPRGAFLSYRSWIDPPVDTLANLASPLFHRERQTAGHRRGGGPGTRWKTLGTVGEVFRFDASAQGYGAASGVIEIKPGSYRNRLRLLLEPERESKQGKLIVDLSDFPWEKRDRVTVEACSLKTGSLHKRSLFEMVATKRGALLVFDLLAGEYEVHIRAHREGSPSTRMPVVVPPENRVELRASF